MLAGYVSISKALWVFTGVWAPEQCAAGPWWALCQSRMEEVGDQSEHYSLAGVPDSP